MTIPTVTLNEMLGDEISFLASSAVDLLSEVEVIFGRDIATQEVFLVYGRHRLQEVLQDSSDVDVDVLMIDILRQTDELNQLLALVQIAKQGYDYVEAA
jgi:hypothetical protein